MLETLRLPTVSARNLGVIFDRHLNLESHINNVCRSAYFHLRNIGSVRNMLSDDACSQLIHALDIVRIDYCNSLLYGLPEYSLDKLQKILNRPHVYFAEFQNLIISLKL